MTAANSNPSGNRGYSIKPKYLDKFRCIGDQCRDTCCAGWQVSIDKTTYKKYRRSTDSQLRTLFKAHTKPVRSGDRSEGNFARIVMDNNGSCPFLSERLCKIQKVAGDKMLSQTCATYPRVTNVVDGIYTQFLTPSCPEAARLMLESDTALDLQIEEMSVREHSSSSSSRRWGLSKDASRSLHTSILEILRVDGKPAWQRLSAVMLLGHLIHSSIKQVNDNQSVEEMLRSMVAEGPSQALLTAAAALPGNLEAQCEIFGGLFKAHAHKFLGGSPLQQAVLGDIADLCPTETNRSYGLESLTLDRYRDGLRVLASFYVVHGHLITNYLVNEFARNAFPLSNGASSLWRECQSVASRYGILRFMLAMRAERRGAAFDREAFIDTVVAFTKRLEHNPSFSEQIKGCFEAAKVDDPGRVLKLLRE